MTVKRSLRYQPTGREFELDLRAFTVEMVRAIDPSEKKAVVGLSDLPIVSAASFISGMVVRGFDGHEWAQSLHPAYSFDNTPEMRAAKAEWQVILYGNTLHSFTNPEADGSLNPAIVYNEKTDKRSWAAMRDFFQEKFGAYAPHFLSV